MDKHTCKLCFRRFHNGRALGGHMRSHVVAAASAAAAAYSPQLSSASTSSADDSKPAQPLSYVLRENPKKSYKLAAPDFAAGAGESSVIQDGESDTESPRAAAVSRRRSKRARRRAPLAPTPAPAPVAPDPEPASSVSDGTPEEDVAISLMMLSRDRWDRPRSEQAEQNYIDDDVAAGDEEEDEDDKVVGPTRSRSRYQCGACKKVFRSYQALGGHRASHKKGKGGCLASPPPPPPIPIDSKNRGNVGPVAPVVHECPFCFRVFDSGQALGGHKRAHMSSSASSVMAFVPPIPSPSPSPSPAKCGDSFGLIDLNLPATATEDDFELSAVYDAEFGSNHKMS